MKHYPHHIGDFDRATRHLTRLERSVYRDLIDLYYDTEQRLTLDMQALCRRIIARTNEEVTAVEQALNEFFTETPTGWYHERCEAEIEAYRKASANHWGRRLTKSQRCAIQAAREAAKLNATPPWLTLEDRSEIARIYAESSSKSKETGVPHDVDHIVPLRGKTVCGLHVPWNLRAIPAYENRRKGNALVEVS